MYSYMGVLLNWALVKICILSAQYTSIFYFALHLFAIGPCEREQRKTGRARSSHPSVSWYISRLTTLAMWFWGRVNKDSFFFCEWRIKVNHLQLGMPWLGFLPVCWLQSNNCTCVCLCIVSCFVSTYSIGTPRMQNGVQIERISSGHLDNVADIRRRSSVRRR